jgi:hypothetical protein
LLGERQGLFQQGCRGHEKRCLIYKK